MTNLKDRFLLMIQTDLGLSGDVNPDSVNFYYFDPDDITSQILLTIPPY